MILRRGIIAGAVLLVIVLGTSFAYGESYVGMSREEFIEEVSLWSGLSKDTLELLYEEAPSLFVNLERVSFTTKVLHLFAEARDDELLVELFERFVSFLQSQVLPGPLQTFLTAVSVYKTSLEVIRDKVFIPRLEESIYEAYRASRLEDWRRNDNSRESIETAFNVATDQWFSGYYAVQEKMYRELLKHKDYNPDLLSESFEKKLRSQIDDFWMNHLELRFQREMLAREESAIREELLRSVAGDLRNLQEAAALLLSSPSPLPEPQALTPEEAQVFSSFRELLARYIEATVSQLTDVPFWVRVGEVLKLKKDLYQVGWQVLTFGEDGKETVLAEDTTQGTLEEFQEALPYLQGELEKLTPQEETEGTEASDVLAAYRETLPRYLEKSARDYEAWEKEQGAEISCFFEIIEAATPLSPGRFKVHYRIVCRRPDGTVFTPWKFEGELNLGEIEANLRSMLEELRAATAPPSPPPATKAPPSETSEGIVVAFREFLPRYLETVNARETKRVREVFGYLDDLYWSEIVDNAREVSPGVFRVHYRSFVRHNGETELYYEYKEDLTADELARLYKNLKEDMGE